MHSLFYNLISHYSHWLLPRRSRRSHRFLGRLGFPIRDCASAAPLITSSLPKLKGKSLLSLMYLATGLCLGIQWAARLGLKYMTHGKYEKTSSRLVDII